MGEPTIKAESVSIIRIFVLREYVLTELYCIEIGFNNQNIKIDLLHLNEIQSVAKPE